MDILFLESGDHDHQTLASYLEKNGHHIHSAANLEEVFTLAEQEHPQVIVLDCDEHPPETITRIRHAPGLDASCKIIVTTTDTSLDNAIASMQEGSYTYLQPPYHAEQARVLMEKIEMEIRTRKRLEALQHDLTNSQPGLLLQSKNPAAQHAYDVAFKAARSHASILLLGANGTGKTVLAKQIHDYSPRKEEAFVTVSCPSLSRELLESTLFGHVKGSFTGASSDTWGKVKAADKGTLFLDEIGELPMEIQPKLLRLLQSHQYERLGENKIRNADVRVIAATNRNISEEVSKGNFREDLLYRLNVITINIPSLNTRTEDVEDLAMSFLHYFCMRQNRPAMKFSDEALEEIRRYCWPGNLREMSNTLERAVILCEHDIIYPNDLRLMRASEAFSGPRVGSPVTIDELVQAHISSIVSKSESMEDAANILGIDTATLYRKRKKMGLVSPRSKRQSSVD